jgi:hypothetical protein
VWEENGKGAADGGGWEGGVRQKMKERSCSREGNRTGLNPHTLHFLEVEIRAL